MPGLLRGIAKTAVVAGTAQATRNTVNRHAAKRNMEAYDQAQQEVQAEHPQYGQPVAYAQPAPAPAMAIIALETGHGTSGPISTRTTG